MSLIKHRPRIKLYAPRGVTPGASFVATAVLEARHAVAIEWIEVRFAGSARATFGSGEARSVTRREITRAAARVCGAREIPVGTTRFECRLAVPAGAPPSFSGLITCTSYVASVHASIPWWPDAKQDFEIHVELPPAPRDRAPAPVLVSSSKGGSEPYVELSLADSVIDAGGILDGSVAFGNVEGARFAGCDVALVAYEQGVSPRGVREQELSRYGIQLSVADPREGQAVSFSMRVPGGLPPSFNGGLVCLRWLVEVRARRRMARDVVMYANVVVMPDPRGEARRRVAPPDVGAERVARLWQSVGEPLGYELVDGALLKTVGETRIAIRRDFTRGPRVLAELRFAPLGIGLDGGQLRGVGRLVGNRGIPLGDAAWDRRHRVAGRFELQLKAFGAALGPALTSQNVAELSDDHIVLEAQGAGLVAKRLQALVLGADVLAQRLPAARAAVPPPPGFDTGAWRALAADLHGSFEHTCIAVHGRLEDNEVDVVTEWAGDVAHATRLVLRPRSPLREKWRGVLPADAALRSALPDDARSLVDRLCAITGELALDGDSVSLSLAAPLERPEHVLDRVDDLARLVGVLARRRGAYR